MVMDQMKSYDELIAEAQAQLIKAGEIVVSNELTKPGENREAAEQRLRAYFLDSARGYNLREVRFDWDHVVDGFGVTYSGKEFARKVAVIKDTIGCSVIGIKK